MAIEVDTETVTHWGVRFGNGVIRWNPTYGGSRPDDPYTEQEARADQALHSGGEVVTRTETTVTVTTPWLTPEGE